MGSMAGTFTIPEFNTSYTITDSNLVRIGDKNFFGRKPCTPPFYLIFTSENHLNAHSSLIKQHMAMNFAPLDYPCQGASSELKKIWTVDSQNTKKFPQKIVEFNTSYTISDKFGSHKKHVLPFYLNSENHLNAHSSLSKQHMAMNFAPLDYSCQGASF
jgi:hypothetical protein